MRRSWVAPIFDFDVAQASGSIDEILIELAAVGANLFDFPLEASFRVSRLPLLVSRCLELFVPRCFSASSFVATLREQNPLVLR